MSNKNYTKKSKVYVNNKKLIRRNTTLFKKIF